MPKNRMTSDGYMKPEMTFVKSKKPVREGDIRFNPITHRNERFSPEGKWIPISPKTSFYNPGQSKTNWEKEFGLGMWPEKSKK